MNFADTQVLVSAIFTTIFFVVILSYYVLLLWPAKKGTVQKLRSITVIIPAHNEARYIERCIESVLAAKWNGPKTIIVVDDGSTDRTAALVKQYPVTLLRQKHTGKSASLNRAIKLSTSDLIAIVDGDSEIAVDALIEAKKKFNHPDVAVVCAVIKVKNRSTVLGLWMHIEQLYASLTRSLYAKVNVNIVAAGPLSIFRRDALQAVGGFRTEGFAEDADVAIRMLRAGYRIEYAERAISETNMPVTWRGFFRQRTRFARGTVNILKRHLRFDHSLVRIYTLPLTFFGYLQAVIMGTFTIYNIVTGYVTYYASQGVYASMSVVWFLIKWLTVIGMATWVRDLIAGIAPFTPIVAVGLLSSLLTYPLYVLAIIKYDRPVTLWHILAVVFLSPFWILVMGVYALNIGEWLRKKQHNIWYKPHDQ